MNYGEYFIRCKKKYEKENNLNYYPKLNDFYEDTVRQVPVEKFTNWMKNINVIKDNVKKWFDDNPDGMMAKYPNVFDFE